ncbi:MAG: NAD(P)/FAD-dependent oxidoreductase [Sulfolobaceae archaeon]
MLIGHYSSNNISNSKKYDYDVLVIGTGPAGYTASIILARAGKRVVVAEKGKVGGLCVNLGCVPSIFLHDLAYYYYKLPEVCKNYGLEITTKLSNYMEELERIINQLSDAGRYLIQDAGAELIYGEAEIIDFHHAKVGGKIISFDKLIIASGTSPNFIPGTIPVDELFRTKKFPSSVIIIGGGYAGVETAQMLSRLGSKVTLISRSKILKNLSEDARKQIIESLLWEEIEIIDDIKKFEIKENKVIIDNKELKADIIVSAIGRKPNIPKGLEKLGVKFDSNGIIVDHLMKTNVENVYAIGDIVNHRNKLAHKAIMEGIVASQNILGNQITIDYESIPEVIYTDPQIAFVGNKESAVRVLKFPFLASTRAIISGERIGYIKLGIDKHERVVYGEIVHSRAEDLINVLTMAVRLKVSVKDLALMSFAHPSLSEVIVQASRILYDLDTDLGNEFRKRLE